MAKDFNAGSDAKLETVTDTGSKAGSDFGGDLASNDGVDLNADVAKRGIVRGAAVFGAVATAGGFFTGTKPNDSYDEARFLENERRGESRRQMEAADVASSGPEYADSPPDPPTSSGFKLPEGYTSNIDELMENENAVNAEAEAERTERWQQYAEAFEQYEAEQSETEQPEPEPIDTSEGE